MPLWEKEHWLWKDLGPRPVGSSHLLCPAALSVFLCEMG